MMSKDCRGKKAFRTRHEAKKVLSRYGNSWKLSNTTNKEVRVDVFKCNQCGYYHLGHDYQGFKESGGSREDVYVQTRHQYRDVPPEVDALIESIFHGLWRVR